MYAIGFLIINNQFILVKIKPNAFFSVGKNLTELRIKHYDTAECLGCCIDAYWCGEYANKVSKEDQYKIAAHI